MSLATAFNYFANSLWQVPLLTLCCWCALRLARAQAQVRYAAWIATLLLCVALPLRGALPRTEALVTVTTGDATVVSQEPTKPASIPFYAVQITPRTRDVLAWIYVAVTGFFLLRLLLAYAVQSRLLRSTEAATFTPAHQALLAELGANAARIRILPAGMGAPMVAGVWRPRVLLPAALLAGNDTTLRAVLAHEFAHLARRDTVINLVLRVVALPVAYHPATAVVERQIRNARELLCDRIAARSLPSAGVYAQALLQLAQALIHTGVKVPLSTVGLFERTSKPLLEERIMNLIAPPAPLHSGFRWLRASAAAAVFCAAVCTVSVVHLTPSVQAAEQTAPSIPAPSLAPVAPQQAPAAKASSHAARRAAQPTMQDADLRGVLAEIDKAAAELRNPQLQRELQEAARAGIDTAQLKKQLDEVRAQVNSPEFKRQIADAIAQSTKALKDSDAIRQQVDSKDFKAQIAKAVAEARSASALTPVNVARLVAEARLQPLPAMPSAGAKGALAQDPPQRVAAGIMQGALLTRVTPVYPEMAKAAGVTGSVVLHAIIAMDGTISALTVVSGPPELTTSAMEAVRQWVYRPYLLNGQPTEVDTTITVTYSMG